MIINGFVLRQYREIYGIKQWLMAARLGFSSAVLCDIEKGRKVLTPEIRQKAEQIFAEVSANRGQKVLVQLVTEEI